MKALLIATLLSLFFILGFKVGNSNMDSLIPKHEMTQVGIVVKDIEQAAERWAAFLGLEETPKINMASSSERVPTQYRGKPSDASAKLAFIRLENITVELIEPVGKDSTWMEFLETKGEGIHHIAFQVKGMNDRILEFGQSEIPMVQRGGWATGEYAYMDGGKNLGLIIELLENYNK
ncbi:MAG: VOC family protein [Puniceicoccaceae bacterium]